jgi:ubiquilin
MFPNIPAPVVQDPEQRFAVQLQQLSEMGFTNRQVNIHALTQTNGNVEAAIERMLL